MQKIAELFSNGLTATTIVLAAVVVFLWAKSARLALNREGPLTTEDWFILGVFLGFVSVVLDNAYWLVAWSLVYVDSPAASDAMAHGVFWNIPFRQVLGSAAAYCHVRAAFQYGGSRDRRANKMLLFAALAGVTYSVLLIIGA